MVRGSESLGERRSAPDPIHGGDGEYAEIQFETQDDANAAVERFNEVLKKATTEFPRRAVYVTASFPVMLPPNGCDGLSL